MNVNTVYANTMGDDEAWDEFMRGKLELTVRLFKLYEMESLVHDLSMNTQNWLDIFELTNKIRIQRKYRSKRYYRAYSKRLKYSPELMLFICESIDPSYDWVEHIRLGEGF